jgi:hypothetical protein
MNNLRSGGGSGEKEWIFFYLSILVVLCSLALDCMDGGPTGPKREIGPRRTDTTVTKQAEANR